MRETPSDASFAQEEDEPAQEEYTWRERIFGRGLSRQRRIRGRHPIDRRVSSDEAAEMKPNIAETVSRFGYRRSSGRSLAKENDDHKAASRTMGQVNLAGSRRRQSAPSPEAGADARASGLPLETQSEASLVIRMGDEDDSYLVVHPRRHPRARRMRPVDTASNNLSSENPIIDDDNMSVGTTVSAPASTRNAQNRHRSHEFRAQRMSLPVAQRMRRHGRVPRPKMLSHMDQGESFTNRRDAKILSTEQRELGADDASELHSSIRSDRSRRSSSGAMQERLSARTVAIPERQSVSAPRHCGSNGDLI